MRAWALAVLLAVAAALVVTGVAMLNEPAGWIAAGVLLAGLSLLMLVET